MQTHNSISNSTLHTIHPNPQNALLIFYINPLSQPYPSLTAYNSLSPLPKVSPFLAVLFLRNLALTQEALEETLNKGVVAALYDALNRRDAEAIQKILAADLEWWFHGPPSHQYFLIRLLTGELQESSFRFVPHSISAFGSTVLAEGFDQSRSIAWVHAWTVTDGIITQVREYFNTSLTVTRIEKTDHSDCGSSSGGIASLRCPSVWESSLPDRVGKSVPGLVLAI